MSLKKRLFSNGFASAGSIFWSAIAQIISVPVLTHAWGLQTFGLWIMMSTVPTYFALSDLGFSTAATSDMTMAYARGDKASVIKTFQSVLVLLSGLCVAFLILTSPIALIPGVLNNVSDEVGAFDLYVFICYGAGILISRAVLGSYRAIGFYARGTIIYDFIQFLEVALALLVAHFGGDILDAVVTMLGVRLANVFILAFDLSQVAPWLKFGLRHASMQEIKRLLRPALNAMVVPTISALNLQGITLVTGFALGPHAVAVLSPVRTLSRIAIQLVGIVNRASLPEFSAAYATEDAQKLHKIINLNIRTILFILFPGVVAFAVAGSWFVRIWSGGTVSPETVFVSVIALGVLLQGMWVFASNLFLAINRVGTFTFALSLAVFVSICTGFVFGKLWGLVGVAVAIALGELISVVGAAYAMLQLSRGGVFNQVFRTFVGRANAG
jgi:O-antigen/teichoic acid export membrane protein